LGRKAKLGAVIVGSTTRSGATALATRWRIVVVVIVLVRVVFVLEDRIVATGLLALAE
jgi:hypothetical protein